MQGAGSGAKECWDIGMSCVMISMPSSSSLQPKTTGQDVVDEIVKSLDIEEKDYFSIYFKEGNQKVCA